MAVKTQSIPVTNLIVNHVTSEKAFQEMQTAGLINENELYFVDETRHRLIFGARGEYIYDGSADVTVPVYTGTII